jgi:CRP-like cAMP-binding protein
MLPEKDRVALDAQTGTVEVRRGQVLFREGVSAESVWAVAKGVVHIVKSGPEGREIVLEVIAPGELFGAVVAIAQRPYPASAVAADDGLVWRFPAAIARGLCQRYPSLRGEIMDQVATRLRSAHERLRSVALEPVEQRLARTVLALAKKIGVQDDGHIALDVTRRELADMVGATVETTIRITSRWQSAGLVLSTRGRIRLLGQAQLEEIAQRR